MTHKWNIDRPGKFPQDDALNRISFAQRVAKEIGAWRQKDSLVISLNGDWGSGKSTLKNLVLYFLGDGSTEPKNSRPVIVEFNPWQWSGQDKLLEGFFNEIGAVFRRNGTFGDIKKAERLARFWEGLRVVSSAGAELAERLQQSLTAGAALVAGGAGVAAGYIDSPTGKAAFASGSLLLMLIAGILGIYAPIAEKFGLVVEWQLKKKKLSLADAKDKLRGELQTLEQPLLVVVDDIDRLTKREVRLLVQLIKANADFPNVVYLLLYQKSIVADALSEITCERGQDFLKKIVQVELEVPAPPDYKMRELFGNGLDRILKAAQIRWDKERWRQLFADAVWPYFRTPRDIKRFLGVFEFYFEGHVADGTLNVNPIDLILIETLRVFDPDAYEAVSRAFQQQRNMFIEVLFDDKEARKRFVLGFKELVERPSIATTDRPRLNALLLGLFPQSREGFDRGSGTEWSRDLRICDSRHFSKYFQLGGDPGDVPASVIARLLRAENTREESRKILEHTIESGNFASLLERLRAVRDDISESQVERLIIALFDVSDRIPKIQANSLVFSSDAERELALLSALLLKRLPDSDARLSTLRKAIHVTGAITGPVLTVSFLSPSKDRAPENQLIEVEKLPELQKALLPRMWEAANSGKIWSLRMPAAIFYRLLDWAGEEPVRTWMEGVLKDSKSAAAFLEHILQESQVSGGSGSKTIYYLRPAQVELFTSLERLISAAEPGAESLLKQEAIRAGKKAMALRAEGKKHDELFVMSFDSEGNPLDDKSDPLGGI